MTRVGGGHFWSSKMERGTVILVSTGELQRNGCQSRVKSELVVARHTGLGFGYKILTTLLALHYALTKLTLRPVAACLQDPLFPPHLLSLQNHAVVNPTSLALSNIPSQPFLLAHSHSFLQPSDLHSLLGTPEPPHWLRIPRGQQQPKHGRPTQQRQASAPSNTSNITTPEAPTSVWDMNSQDIISPPKHKLSII